MALAQHTVHHRHHVEPLAAAHGVMHHMQARAEPGGDRVVALRGGQVVSVHHAPVGQVATGAHRLRAQHLRPHTAPQAVAANEGLPLQRRVAFGRHLHGIGRLLISGHARVEVQAHTGFLLDGAQQQAVQVGAVQGGVGLGVAGQGHGTQAQLPQPLAAVCIAHPQQLGKGGAGLQLVRQAPGMQHAHRIGPQLQARAHFAKGAGLLQHVHRNPGPGQRQRAGQTPNAATGDHHMFIHGKRLCRPRARRP